MLGYKKKKTEKKKRKRKRSILARLKLEEKKDKKKKKKRERNRESGSNVDHRGRVDAGVQVLSFGEKTFPRMERIYKKKRE